MKRKRSFLLPLISIVLCISAYSQGQLWSGVIAPTRAVDWSTTGVTGGIPNRTTTCATIAPYTGSAAAINNALNSCASGGVVLLSPAGAYTLSSSIVVPSNVTLRGLGANQTSITFSNGASFGTFFLGQACGICINGGGAYTAAGNPSPFSTGSNTVSWKGTNGSSGVYTAGATVLNMGSTPSGLSVGTLLILFQQDDSAPTSGLFVCSVVPGCAIDGSRGTGEQQIVKVTAVSGTQVTVTPGVWMNNWVTAKNPQAGWFPSPISGAGVEDLSINTGSHTVFSNIGFWNAIDSWVKGVASQETGARDHIMAADSYHVSVQDSFLEYNCTTGCAGAATGYGLETWASTSVLLQNNILAYIESPFLFSCCTTGLVAGYNYIAPCNSTWCPNGDTGLASHEEGFLMSLYEGNDVDHIRLDTFHGTQNLLTIFRNHSLTYGEGAIDSWAYNRYLNSVGNVLGNNTANNYACAAPSAAGNCGRYNPNIFRMGYPDANTGPGPSSGINDDSQVASTMLRWGNYDTMTAAARWCGNSSDTGWTTTCSSTSEVPTADSHYPNAVPTLGDTGAGQGPLPDSFYLASQPNWWPSGKPFPPIGPDVTGGNIAGLGGHAYTIPANDCYLSIGGNIANFNADTCYGSNGNPPPDPPTGLNAVVQ